MIEMFLRWLTRRCEFHATVSYGYLTDLESDLGLPVTEPAADFVLRFADSRLIDCGHPWCPEIRSRHPRGRKVPL